jgi:hypothetical protein
MPISLSLCNKPRVPGTLIGIFSTKTDFYPSINLTAKDALRVFLTRFGFIRAADKRRRKHHSNQNSAHTRK